MEIPRLRRQSRRDYPAPHDNYQEQYDSQYQDQEYYDEPPPQQAGASRLQKAIERNRAKRQRREMAQQKAQARFQDYDQEDHNYQQDDFGHDDGPAARLKQRLALRRQQREEAQMAQSQVRANREQPQMAQRPAPQQRSRMGQMAQRPTRSTRMPQQEPIQQPARQTAQRRRQSPLAQTDRRASSMGMSQDYNEMEQGPQAVPSRGSSLGSRLRNARAARNANANANPAARQPMSAANQQQASMSQTTTRTTRRSRLPSPPGSKPAAAAAPAPRATRARRATTTRKTATRKTTRRASASKPASQLPPWANKTLVWGGWIFAGLLLTRLIFAERGVIDYYSKQEMINTRVAQLDATYNENDDLKLEINKLSKNSSYQKKIAREHLGVIAKDEYLILFARDAREKSK